MACAILIRRALDGRLPAPGARPATQEIELHDYAPLFAARRIIWGMRTEPAPGSLYQRLLGSAWASLPEPIRAMHEGDRAITATGRAAVERGRSWTARALAMLFRFPPTSHDIAVTVQLSPESAGGEIWRRNFGGHRFSSRQRAGRGRSQHLLVESFGPFAFAMALVVDEDRLRLILRRWSVLGISLPLAIGPWSNAHERVADGRFHFDVEIGHRLAGRIVRYSGWLVRD